MGLWATNEIAPKACSNLRKRRTQKETFIKLKFEQEGFCKSI